jgi:hypothetical protein
MKTPINFKNKNMIEKEAPGRNLKPYWRRRFPRGGGGREGGRELGPGEVRNVGLTKVK